MTVTTEICQIGNSDIMTPSQRKKAMAHNRGRTKPELAFASELWKKGFRYLTAKGYEAKYRRKLLGHPDIVFPRKGVVIFVDGCFWHGCPDCGGPPTQSGKGWFNKIQANVERDRRVTEALQAQGWEVLRIAEHSLKSKALLTQTAESVVGLLKSRVI